MSKHPTRFPAMHANSVLRKLSASVFLTLCCLLFATADSSAQCTALFTFEEDSTNCGTVHFSDSSTSSAGPIVIYGWEIYEDNDTINYSVQNPSHTFTENGTYWVRLWITTPIFCIDFEDQFITISCFCDPSDSTFSVSECTSYTVPSGDTTYTTPGTYTVMDTIPNHCGADSLLTINLFIGDTIAPITPTLADVTGACAATATVPTTTDNCAGVVTGTTTDPLAYYTQGTHVITWTFDDGNGNSIMVPQNIIIDSVTYAGTGCAQPTNLAHKFVQDNSATVTWDVVCSASAYRVYYKPVGGSTWIKQQVHSNKGFTTLTGLNPSTKYMWRMQASCTAGTYTPLTSSSIFTTLGMPCTVPSGLSTGPVQSDQARLNWQGMMYGPIKTRVRWREQGSSVWTTVAKDGSRNKHWVTGLNSSTAYEWQIKSICESGVTSGTQWSALQIFITAPAAKTAISNRFDSNDKKHTLSIFPNPSNGAFNIAGDLAVTRIEVIDMMGRVCTNKVHVHGKQVDASALARGNYLLRFHTESQGIVLQKLMLVTD